MPRRLPHKILVALLAALGHLNYALADILPPEGLLKDCSTSSRPGCPNSPDGSVKPVETCDGAPDEAQLKIRTPQGDTVVTCGAYRSSHPEPANERSPR